ncbi:MAG: dihydrofolate reductase family protein [Solirubrobacterales bacterium]|nr:dihydrofolate reductase family protein [Solirubrobacterales bacterium]
MAEFSGHVFIGVSLDGFIARPDGDLKWLTERGLPFEETGYEEFAAGIDALIMGRSTYEIVAAMDEWFYTKPVFVLSTTLDPSTVERDDVSVHRDVDSVLEAFGAAGFTKAYVDGGATIQNFIRLGLVDSLTLTFAPVLIGSGARLFGELITDVDLELEYTKTLPAGFVQTKYLVRR